MQIYIPRVLGPISWIQDNVIDAVKHFKFYFFFRANRLIDDEINGESIRSSGDQSDRQFSATNGDNQTSRMKFIYFSVILATGKFDSE